LNEEGMVWMAERFDEVKKLFGVHIQFAEHFLCPPAIQVLGKPTDEYSRLEVLGFRNFLTILAGPLGELKASIRQLDQKYPQIDSFAAIELRKIIIRLIDYSLRVRRKTRSLEEIQSVIHACGYDDLVSQITGHSVADDEIQIALSQYLWKAYTAVGINF
jgi:hypothetical protein